VRVRTCLVMRLGNSVKLLALRQHLADGIDQRFEGSKRLHSTEHRAL